MARELLSALAARGYSATYQNWSISAGFMSARNDAISSCEFFVPILTNNYASSIADQELKFALEIPKSRGKKIVPIFVNEGEPFSAPDFLEGFNIFEIECDEISRAVEYLDHIFKTDLEAAILYEKLSEFSKIKDHNRIARCLCQLLNIVHNNIVTFGLDREHAEEIYRLFLRLSDYIGGYDDESRAMAKEILATIDKFPSLYASLKEFKTDPYYISMAIKLIYLDREIRSECADVITSGDVHDPCPINSYIKKQGPFVELYQRIDISDIREADKEHFKSALEFILSPSSAYVHSTAPERPQRSASPALSEDEEILVSVADFIKEGNRLFDLLHQKGVAGDFLKCLLTSYERLKNYCDVVGAKGVAADCIEKIAEIRQELSISSEGQGDNVQKAENGIKSLLGLTLSGSGVYDVFISFKSDDEDLGRTIYNYFKENMIEAFWSKVSLPELSKSDYGDAIDNALDKSKHFVLVISNLDYLETYWVKYEMNVFRDEMREGRKTNANFVIVATDSLYEEIIKSNKTLLPIKYRSCQIIRMSEYKATLLQYIT